MKNWKEVDGWFNEINEKFFDSCIEKLNYPKVFYEVGSWKGRSTCCMAQLLKQKNIPVKLYAIDTFLGSGESIHNQEIENLKRKNLTLYDVFLSNILDCGVDDIVVPIKSTGEEACSKVENNSVDFLYLDAAHNYNSVKNDINMWIPKMKKGSIISGDDYVACWPGVIKAVNEIFKDLEKEVDIFETQWRVFL